MSVFETVKAAVTPRQAAEHYGLRVLPNGMACCPFHKDRHPSLKLNEDYFFCFGCGASGDVIDFTARLFGISLKDAADSPAKRKCRAALYRGMALHGWETAAVHIPHRFQNQFPVSLRRRRVKAQRDGK